MFKIMILLRRCLASLNNVIVGVCIWLEGISQRA